MSTRILTAAIISALTVAGMSAAKADPVSVGYRVGTTGSITTLDTGVGTASGTTTSGRYTISMSAIGSPVVVEPNFSSNTVTIKSTGAGTIQLYATESNVNARVPSFQLGFSNNPLSDVSVTESFYLSTTNQLYATDTLLASATLAPGDTIPMTTTTGAPATGQYSITEMYTVTFGTGGGTLNATIIERASAAAVPEPMSMSLLGAGLVGLGFIRRRRA